MDDLTFLFPHSFVQKKTQIIHAKKGEDREKQLEFTTKNDEAHKLQGNKIKIAFLYSIMGTKRCEKKSSSI